MVTYYKWQKQNDKRIKNDKHKPNDAMKCTQRNPSQVAVSTPRVSALRVLLPGTLKSAGGITAVDTATAKSIPLLEMCILQ